MFNVSLAYWCFLSPFLSSLSSSLKLINISSGEDKKKLQQLTPQQLSVVNESKLYLCFLSAKNNFCVCHRILVISLFGPWDEKGWKPLQSRMAEEKNEFQRSELLSQPFCPGTSQFSAWERLGSMQSLYKAYTEDRREDKKVKKSTWLGLRRLQVFTWFSHQDMCHILGATQKGRLKTTTERFGDPLTLETSHEISEATREWGLQNISGYYMKTWGAR